MAFVSVLCDLETKYIFDRIQRPGDQSAHTGRVLDCEGVSTQHHSCASIYLKQK